MLYSINKDKNIVSSPTYWLYQFLRLTGIDIYMQFQMLQNHRMLVSYVTIIEKQFGFISGRSTVLQLLHVLDKWTKILDKGGCVDIIQGAYHCSDSPLFRRPIIPTTHYSDNPLYRQPITPTAHFPTMQNRTQSTNPWFNQVYPTGWSVGQANLDDHGLDRMFWKGKGAFILGCTSPIKAIMIDRPGMGKVKN